MAEGTEKRGLSRTHKPLQALTSTSRLSTPVKFVGSVEAPDADAAIAKAIEEFKVDPAREGRSSRFVGPNRPSTGRYFQSKCL